ncbi:GAF domain-containing protein [Sphingobium aromaticiconvertens]|uniref:GAF domain-containing protein n=1 Tax=Sphingobium aromaticiconvertens TaxID=365341 RepID=UPI0030161188
MKDSLALQAVARTDDDAIRAILEDVCRITQMGFAAVARVTEDRWIACQVLDKIEFGLDPGDELKIKTTICDDIRQSGAYVVIDHVDLDMDWRTHHTPMLYGFKSYASFPILLADGSFYGTLCAIDPNPKSVSGAEVVTAMQAHAQKVAEIVSARIDIASSEA